MPGRIIAVLGMHRSGTSCLVGLLEQAGGFPGGVSRKNPANVKGNGEKPRITAVHHELLKVNGGGGGVSRCSGRRGRGWPTGAASWLFPPVCRPPPAPSIFSRGN